MQNDHYIIQHRINTIHGVRNLILAANLFGDRLGAELFGVFGWEGNQFFEAGLCGGGITEIFDH